MGCHWEKSWDHSAGREPNLSCHRGLSKECTGETAGARVEPEKENHFIWVSPESHQRVQVTEFNQPYIKVPILLTYCGPETSQMNHIQLTDVRLERPKETNQYICKQLQHLIIIKVPSVVSDSL